MPAPELDPGVVAGIHVFDPLPSLPRLRVACGEGRGTWMAGTRPAMTALIGSHSYFGTNAQWVLAKSQYPLR
jgi:hypothetical protein